MLKLEQLSKLYKTKGRVVRAIDSIDLEFEKGEFVSILGLSGSGKTTLVSQIGGLDSPSEGTLNINGVDTGDYSQQDWANYRLNNIGFVFQDFNLMSHLTAKENIEIALSLSGYTMKEKSDRADELLAMMGLSYCYNQLPTQLSGGEKQRVAIARALANRPEIILADEPTGALDPDTSVQIMTILKKLSKEGHLVIMVTHNKYLARDYSTRIVELSGGKVIKEEILESHVEYTEDHIPVKRSSLELTAAFKIAFNNLKLRKKSTMFSLVSLVPSIVLIFALVNLIFNLSGYRKDFEPITNAVLNSENVYYITPFTDERLDMDIKNMFKYITDKQFDYDKVNAFIEKLVQPYTKEQLKEIAEIKGVETVLDSMMFNVNIDNNDFIMVTLPPEAYQGYQYAVDEQNYPEDDEIGMILSLEAAKRLKGKYSDNLTAIEGEDLEVTLLGINGFGLSRFTYQEQRQNLSFQVLDVIDVKAKTTLIENYYGGYIFVPYDMGLKIYESFESSDLTMVATIPPDPLSGETEPIVIGPLFVMDLLKPLREKTMLQDSYNLFSFREYSYMMPSNNYGIKRLVITDEDFDENSKAQLATYGEVYTSAYDEMTLSSAETTDRYIRYTIWGASAFALLIILIPSLLVCVILYISILLRIKEIGILKSVGARNKDVLYIFTIEAGIVAATGTTLGIIIALPVIKILQRLLENQYRISFYLGSNPMAYNVLGLVLAAVSAFVLVTMFGLLPGRKASKLEPNVLLKHIN